MPVRASRNLRELRTYVTALRRWLWLLCLCTVVAAASGYVASKAQHPVYRATTVLIVEPQGTSGQDLFNALQVSEQLAVTYAGLVQQPIVLDRAAQQLKGVSAATLAREVKATADTGAPIVRIQVDDTNPVRAATVANAVALALTTVLLERGFASSEGVIPLQQFQPAVPPNAPDHPKALLNAAIAAALGLILAVILVLLIEFLDDRIRTPVQAEAVVDAPLLGNIDKQRLNHVLLTENAKGSPAIEASFRALCANLSFATLDKPLRTIAVTSATVAEGKTTVAINLAEALARSGKRVLLIDADLHHPQIHELLGISNSRGLSQYLQEENCTSSVVSQRHGSRRSVLTAGPHPLDSAELLGSCRMGHFLQSIFDNDVADIVVIDTPPVATYVDAARLAGYTDGTLLVIDSSQAREEAVVRAKAVLDRVHARIVGIVLNHTPGRMDHAGFHQQPNEQTSTMEEQMVPHESSTSPALTE
ncbi:MAG TPA: polysaccharide biosynthesis tyrosine autokinase [Ktedonobacterales bacterium]